MKCVKVRCVGVTYLEMLKMKKQIGCFSETHATSRARTTMGSVTAGTIDIGRHKRRVSGNRNMTPRMTTQGAKGDWLLIVVAL